MDIGRGRRLAAGGRTDEEADLEQEGLDHLGQGLGLVIDGRRDGLEPDGAAAVLLDDGAEEAAIEPVEAGRVHALAVERVDGPRGRYHAAALDLDVVSHPAQEPVGDPRRPARALGDRGGAIGLDVGAQNGRRAGDDGLELLQRIEVEVVEDPEALAERRGQHPRPRGRAHHGEGAERDAHGPGVETLVHDEVDREVLHRRVEQLLDHPRQPVDLVHEEDVALVDIGQDAHEVAAALERRPRRGDHGGAHLVGENGRERRLPETRRSREQHVVERLAALARRLHRHPQALDGRALAHVLVEPLGAQLALDLRLFRQGDAAHHARLVGHGLAPR